VLLRSLVRGRRGQLGGLRDRITGSYVGTGCRSLLLQNYRLFIVF
jgi:hypothetical protein